MSDKSLLINIKAPATLEVCEHLSDCLVDGAVGGFHPCGMWDYIVDYQRLVWCGMQFYFASGTAKEFESANPYMDRSLMRVRDVNDLAVPTDVLATYAENGTTHVLQVVWSDSPNTEIHPALEFCDYWYAPLAYKEAATGAARLTAAREFSALAILGFNSKLDEFGIGFPRKLKFPMVDRSVM